MAKISPTSIKYSIVADFASEGPVTKPDVIGALFGQTEGLLGSDMELRELQKEGKIGRIEVNLTSENGKTKGEIIIPSALDKTETTIIAASLETIDKIGPTDASITVKEIDDVRGSKRDYIMERAKKLLANISNQGMDSTEMETELRESTRAAKAVEYGDEKLAAGPNLDEQEEIIVVEGRADVVNMLKQGINNVIGMDGTKLPKTIAKLGEEKELTLFVDGDRGGRLIAKNVCDNANIKYIATAPDGKEVEELAGKEIHMALRKKVSAEDFLKNAEDFRGRSRERDNSRRGYSSHSSNERYSRDSRRESFEPRDKRDLTSDDKKKVRDLSGEIKGKNVTILDENLNFLKAVPVSKLNFLREENAFVLMVSHATEKVVEGAGRLKAKAVAAKTFGKISGDSADNIELISL